jgi:uncharacterized phage-associated protein
MAVHPFVAAKKVCELRSWGASNLEIQKILYLCHLVALGRSNGARGLITDRFQAWDYGPVVPALYHRAKPFGSGPVQNVFQIFPNAAGDDASLIEETVKGLAGKSAGELVAITHWDKGAWAKNYVPGASGIVIPDADILEEYRLRVQ